MKEGGGIAGLSPAVMKHGQSKLERGKGLFQFTLLPHSPSL